MDDTRVDSMQHDGRRIAVHWMAEGDGQRTILFCHPAPGAGNFDPAPEHTRERAVTLLAPDRPGYGVSDPASGTAWASIRVMADDLAVLLAQYGIASPVGVVGWSAGGRVALAFAAHHPQLVDRVVVVGTPAPHEAVPWIPPEQQAAIDYLKSLPADEARAALEHQLQTVIPQEGSVDASQMLGLSEADAPVLAEPTAQKRLQQMVQSAFAQGAVGLANDLASYTLQPWGFAPEQVQAKTLLLYGAKDPVAGPKHGTWWQRHLPNARLEVSPNAGHLLVMPLWHRALAHLAPHTKHTAII